MGITSLWEDLEAKLLTPGQLLAYPWKVWGITVQTSYWEGLWHQNCGYTSPILFFLQADTEISETELFRIREISEPPKGGLLISLISCTASANSSGMCMCALVLFIYHTWRPMEKCMWNTRWVKYCHSASMTNDHGPAFLKRLREVVTDILQSGWP